MSLKHSIDNIHFIRSVDDLCRKLQISESDLGFMLRKIPKLYRKSKIEKGNGELRILHKPDRQLLSLQKKIRKHILEPIPVDPCVHGYRKGRSSMTNAQVHAGNSYLAKLDIKGFFPSIHYTRVEKLFTKLGCSLDVSKILTRLTTHNYCLPQGAATSPDISNLILVEIDDILATKCERKDLVYTRYSDDTATSGNWNFSGLLDSFIEIIERNGFRVSREKTCFLGPSEQKEITGYITNEKVNVSKDRIRRLRATIHNCIMYGHSTQNIEDKPDFEASLKGQIQYVQRVNPHVGEQLLRMLHKVDWDA